MIKYTNELHNIIRSKVPDNYEIVCVFQTGSSLLLSIYRDIDLIVLVKDYKIIKERRYEYMNHENFDFDGMHYDCFFVDEQDFFEKTTCLKAVHCISLFTAIQNPKFVYFGTIPDTYKQINWRERLINILQKSYKDFLEIEAKQTQADKSSQKFAIEKVFYWDWFLVCLLRNESLSFSVEQLYIAQQIHNYKTSIRIAKRWKTLAEEILFNEKK